MINEEPDIIESAQKRKKDLSYLKPSNGCLVVMMNQLPSSNLNLT